MNKESKKLFSKGQLCYVVFRKLKGRGKRVALLHEATIVGTDARFYYGNDRLWKGDPTRFKQLRGKDK